MNQTKRAICDATKQEVVTRPFLQVNVTTIMRAAGLRRQTFYDYFRDKYDALGFIYREEIDTAAAYCRHYQYWSQTLTTILQYFDTNRDFYRHVIGIDEQNAPITVIHAHIADMMGDVITDMCGTEHIVVADDYAHFLRDMLSTAFVGAIQSWVLDPRPVNIVTENKRLGEYIQDSFDGLVQHQRQQNGQRIA